MAKYIINEKWYLERKTDVEDEAEHIVVVAAKTVRAEISEHQYNSLLYPTIEDIANIDQRRK